MSKDAFTRVEWEEITGEDCSPSMSLPDTINRILADALAKQDTYSRGILGVPFGDEPDPRKVTRKILGAFADVLDDRYGVHRRMLSASHVWCWLRSQIGAEND